MTLIAHLIIVILAITIHEVAHGYAADRLGDFTARRAGRLSLNPLRHVDLVGTLILPALLYAATAGTVMFGYAKAVPVTFGLLTRTQGAFVALAGPLSNLVQAMIWLAMPPSEIARFGALVNLAIGLINLLPIPPLDGGRALLCVLPVRQACQLARIEPYGIWIAFSLIILLTLSSISL